MDKWIWLDMDGTFVDLYGVKNWLADLQSLNTRPYEIARPLVNTWSLLGVLLWAKENGYNIGVISWLSRNPSVDYGERVTKAKLDWLKKHDLDFILEEVLTVPYGVNKSDVCKKYGYGILFEDEKPNRESWKCGKAVNPCEDLVKAILENIR